MMRQKRYVEAGDQCRLCYVEEGEGQPVVFLHGWSSTGIGSFGRFIKALKKDARCICPDLRGHGSSDVKGSVSIDRLIDDLHELILALTLQEVILVGHSLGGLVIYGYFAKYHGDRIAGVHILDMSPKVLCDSSWNYGLRLADDPFSAYMERILQGRTGETMALEGTWLKSWANDLVMMSAAPFGFVLYALWLDMLDADYREGLGKTSVPMVYYHTNHGMYPSAITEWLKRATNGPFQSVDLFPANHFTMLEKTEPLVLEIKKMLNKKRKGR